MREFSEFTMVQALFVAEKFLQGLLGYSNTHKISPLVLRIDSMPLPTAEEEYQIESILGEAKRLPEPLASIRRGFKILKALDWPTLTGWPAGADLKDSAITGEHTAAIIVVTPLRGLSGKVSLNVIHRDTQSSLGTTDSYGNLVGSPLGDPTDGEEGYCSIRGTWKPVTPQENIRKALTAWHL